MLDLGLVFLGKRFAAAPRLNFRLPPVRSPDLYNLFVGNSGRERLFLYRRAYEPAGEEQ